MLGSKKSAFSGSATTTLIAPDTTVVGDIHFSGCLDVEGVVQGNIIAKEGQEALLRIIECGRVEGEIRVPSVIINGAVEGDVHASRNLELAPKAQVQGDVYYSRVEMAAGAEVNGALKHQEKTEEVGRKPDPTISVVEASAAAGKSKVEKLVKAKVD
jgi:cytoskeletal protein CcmA (bactofilin family)